MCSRRALLSLLLVAALWLASWVHTAAGQNPPAPTPKNKPTLKETLVNGLKARRPNEFRFIDRVVSMVENQQLPLELVQSTFQWARKKKLIRYPFQYFERGLIRRARDKGIVIPPA